MILKTLFSLILLVIANFSANTQNAVNYSNEVVKLMSNQYNKSHPYYELFAKKENDYIKWLYYHCVGYNTKLIAAKPENNSLIFEISNNNQKRVDTIKNCVHPKVYENERTSEWRNEIPIYGKLPDNAKIHLKNDSKKDVDITLTIEEKNMKVNLYILTEKGTHVKTLVNNMLSPGKHSFNWNFDTIKKGKYLVYTILNDDLLIHQINVYHNWLSNLFKSNKRSSIKRVYAIDDINWTFEKAKDEQSIFINHDRHGSAVGISLLSDAKVDIKLRTIKGQFLSKIVNSQLSKGAHYFNLSVIIKKQGTYLLEVSIDENTQYINAKLNK